METLEYKYETHYYPYYRSDNNVHQTFLTVYWKPNKNQSCLSITYFHNLNSDMEIILSVSNENDTIIASPILEKNVSKMLLSIINTKKNETPKYQLFLSIFLKNFIYNN